MSLYKDSVWRLLFYLTGTLFMIPIFINLRNLHLLLKFLTPQSLENLNLQFLALWNFIRNLLAFLLVWNAVIHKFTKSNQFDFSYKPMEMISFLLLLGLSFPVIFMENLLQFFNLLETQFDTHFLCISFLFSLKYPILRQLLDLRQAFDCQ